MEFGITERMHFTSPNIRKPQDAGRIQEELAGVEGIRDVEVDPDSHEVTISFDPTVTSELKIRGILESHGVQLDQEVQETPA